MFLPVTVKEMQTLGWEKPDIILVSGDAYIDSPFSGVAVIGKYLMSKGFKVAVIPQPNIDSSEDICRFGEPELFWGITAGCVDSMVANYTAAGKPRRACDFTPGGVNNKRPDRASIVYTGLIRRYFKNTVPIVLGGVEASLRRVAHYDFKTDKIRRSILFDAKADILVYGMGESSSLELATALRNGKDWQHIRGLCYISKEKPQEATELPSFDDVAKDKNAFCHMFKVFYDNSDAVSGTKLVQKTGDRYLVQNEPAIITRDILDEVNELDYERRVHPSSGGIVRGEETVKFSLTSHRGCFGGCSFCAITVHQGRAVISRSPKSVLKEAKAITALKGFKGIITDVGGPTANMYGMECEKMLKKGGCRNKHCLYPTVCKSMKTSHKPLIDLLQKVSELEGVRKVFAASGVRPDLVLADREHGHEYIKALAYNYVSGQIKLAPESADENTLAQMKKPGVESLIEFIKLYNDASRKAGKNQFVSCYFMAAHPGSNMKSMEKTKDFAKKYLSFIPEQVQIFTPTPSTWSTCTYYTGMDEKGNPVFCQKDEKGRQKQKDIIVPAKSSTNKGKRKFK
ncbi:MAG: YgiQ family radical SAM protein [Deferribacterales bacterium]|nr:YgiQ family radical SAM protein [Deferribacterales bacterium]